MAEDRFETIAAGDEEEFSHTITEADVQAFAGLTGDDNPLHMDDAYAGTTGFGKRVVHGMLTASFLSTMIGTRLPGKGALWYEQNLKFLAPVRIGETVRVWARVRHKSEVQRVVVLETVVFGGDGRRVIEGEGKIKVLRPKQPQSTREKAMREADKGAVIVTGASRGIGAAVALALAEAGHPVVINYKSDAAGAEALASRITDAGGKALAFAADVADAAAVRAMVEEAVRTFGALDGVVNNASGPVGTADFLETEWADVARHIDVQLGGAYAVCREALPHLLGEGKSGCVVNIGSTAVDNLPPARQTGYCLAKAALAQFTRCLAVEFGPKGLRVNTVSPGMTQTEFIADFPEKAKVVNKMQTPLRRLAEPADVAAMVAFLFSGAAAHMTGQNLRVCGGSEML